MKKVEFLTDFAGKIKGEIWACDSMLASDLVSRKVAKYFIENKVLKEPIENKKLK